MDRPSKRFLPTAELSNAKPRETQPIPEDSEGYKLLDSNVHRRDERQNSISCQSHVTQEMTERILNESPRVKQLYSLEQQGTVSSHQLAEENNFFSDQLKSHKENPPNSRRGYTPGFKSYSGQISKSKRRNKAR